MPSNLQTRTTLECARKLVTWRKHTRSRGEHSTSIQTAPVVRIILGLWCCEAATLPLYHNAAIVNSDIGSDLVLSQAQSTVPSDA